MRYIYKACYKTAKYRLKTCYYKQSPYLCSVFFIVLDLRLTKDWLSGIDSLFLCFKTGEFLHKNGSPDKPGGLSIQLCKSEKKEFYIRYSS